MKITTLFLPGSASRLFFLSWALIALASPITVSAEKAKAKGSEVPVYRNAPAKSQSAQAEAGKNSQEPSVIVADYAQKNGIRTCVKRIDQVHRFLIGKSPTGIFTFVPPTGNPDEQLFSTSLEVLQADASPAYASSSYSPSGIACNAEYETVTYRAKSCQKLAAEDYRNLKAGNPLKKNIQVLEGSQMMRIFLMPADKGCVVIKKELVY